MTDQPFVPPGILEDCRLWLASQRSPATAKAYGADWRSYWRWTISECCDIYEITRNHLERWRTHLLLDEKLQASTVNRKCQAIRSWQTWLTENRDAAPQTGPRKLPTPNVSETPWLTPHQQQVLIAAASRRNPEQRALIWLLMHGLRRAEALDACVGQLREHVTDTDRYWTLIVIGKGGHVRQLRIANRCHEILIEAAGPHPTPRTRFLRSPLTGGRRTADWPNRVVRSIAADHDLPHITPHMLRHTFAVNQARAGATDRQIQRALGHQDLRTTETYLHGIEDWDTNPIERIARKWLTPSDGDPMPNDR